MSKGDKLLRKIKNQPKDVRWREVVKLLTSEGYEMRKGEGSTRVFRKPGCMPITLHEPHGQRRMPIEAIKKVLEVLDL